MATARKKKPTKHAVPPPLREYPMTTIPCPRCLPLAQRGDIRAEGVQPLPAGAGSHIHMRLRATLSLFDPPGSDKLRSLDSFAEPLRLWQCAVDDLENAESC